MHQASNTQRGELRVVTTIIELARPIGVVIRKVHPTTSPAPLRRLERGSARHRPTPRKKSRPPSG